MSALAPYVLAVLGCPLCKGALAERAAPSRVTCTRCGVNWPVEDGVPRLTPERASAEPALADE